MDSGQRSAAGLRVIHDVPVPVAVARPVKNTGPMRVQSEPAWSAGAAAGDTAGGQLEAGADGGREEGGVHHDVAGLEAWWYIPWEARAQVEERDRRR